MRVLVTGAAGFVGRPLCAHLAAEGHEVVAATRVASESSRGVRNEVVGDLRGMKTWPILDGCDAVVHLAAHVHRVDTRSEDARLYREVNVDATARLAHEAKARGVGRFIFLSTVKVHGESTEVRPFDESSPIAPSDAYGWSKAEAEVIVRASGVPNVVLRPPLVYGPGVGANFLRLMAAVAKRRPLPLGGIANRRSLVFVDNLVDAIRSCLTNDLERERTFLVRDGEDVSSPGLVRQIATALGVAPRLISVPEGLLKLGGFVFGRGAAVRRLVGSLQVDDSAIRNELGWTPPYSLEAGLQRTAEWYRAWRTE